MNCRVHEAGCRRATPLIERSRACSRHGAPQEAVISGTPEGNDDDSSHPMQSLMAHEEIQVTIDPAYTAAIRRLIQEQRGESPDQCINTILGIFLASETATAEASDDPARVNELLRLRIADLEHQLRKKDDALSVMLDLWESCVMKREEAAEEVSSDVDDRVARLIRDWYYDTERKDHSGTNGDVHGHG